MTHPEFESDKPVPATESNHSSAHEGATREPSEGDSEGGERRPKNMGADHSIKVGESSVHVVKKLPPLIL